MSYSSSELEPPQLELSLRKLETANAFELECELLRSMLANSSSQKLKLKLLDDDAILLLRRSMHFARRLRTLGKGMWGIRGSGARKRLCV